MKSTRTVLALFAVSFAIPLAAAAQDEEAIDDVVVVGEKSMADLRREVYQAEEDFYSLHNKFNTNRDFNVSCFYETPTGTRVKNHVCRARFVTKAYSSHAARNRNDLSRIANQDANPAFAEKSARFQENMEALIAANPELQAALARYNALRAQFLEQREETASN